MPANVGRWPLTWGLGDFGEDRPGVAHLLGLENILDFQGVDSSSDAAVIARIVATEPVVEVSGLVPAFDLDHAWALIVVLALLAVAEPRSCLAARAAVCDDYTHGRFGEVGCGEG